MNNNTAILMKDFEKTRLLGSDFDDTITPNSMEVYIELYLEALQTISISLTPDQLREIVQPVWGQSAEEVIRYTVGFLSLQPEMGGVLEPDAILAAVEHYESALRSGVFVSRVTLIPGAISALEAVRERGVQIGLATGLAPELLDELLIKHGVPDDLFIDKISAYDIRKSQRKKPDPYSLKRLKRVAGIAVQGSVLNNQIVYVGDSENDVKMARRLPGVEPVVVLTGNLTRQHAKSVLRVPGSNILKNICQIEEVLERREFVH